MSKQPCSNQGHSGRAVRVLCADFWNLFTQAEKDEMLRDMASEIEKHRDHFGMPQTMKIAKGTVFKRWWDKKGLELYGAIMEDDRFMEKAWME